MKTKRGGDIFEKNSNIFWNASVHASDVSDRCLGSRKWRNNHSGAGMAVHSFCGAAALHRRDAADQSLIVGSTSATCGTYVDSADGDSVCSGLWYRQSNRDSS